jgi:hypothetical protein
MDKSFFFERNLLALSRVDPILCTQLSGANRTLKHYQFMESRSGETIPTLTDSKGAVRPLHSLVDPQREGSRLISLVKDEGFLIFLGLGGGFSIAAALEREDIQRVLVIDYDIDGVAELLGAKEYTKIFTDPRFHILVDPSSSNIEQYILDCYQPVLFRGIRVVPLRTRTELDQPLFNEAGDAINRALNRVSGDYSVQAYFGTRWFSNIIRNILKAEAQDGPIPSIRHAAISAAGPSLDMQLPLIAKKRGDFFLIATDTSLPSLLQARLEPDAVVSIDCQHISYHHFMAGLPTHIPLYLDLASPPVVSSRSSHPRFFSGGHPLTRYISRYWRPLPVVDTSGANVTYAALSLADMLGAEQVELYGADFSYPLGRTYSRGTYIYPYFEIRQTRLSPLENLFSAFLFRDPALKRVNREAAWYYETPALTRYRTLLEEKTGSIKTRVMPAPGMGAPLTIRENREPHSRTIWLFAPGSPSMKAQDFLAEYQEKIRRLPVMGGSAWAYLRNLNNEEYLILATLLPQAAAIKRRNPQMSTNELIEAVRSYSLEEIDKVLHTADKGSVL